MTQPLAIVLTAAIIVSPGSTAVEEASARRGQYLSALRFYARFAPVYFLENSGYDLMNDSAFAGIPNVHLRSVTAGEDEARGKGYREFRALDGWYTQEKDPPQRILKITGRYLYANISALLQECRETSADVLLFDLYRDDRVALTSLFSVSWEDYGRYIQGLHVHAEDSSGAWIERLVYRGLLGAKTRSFRHEPDIGGISGSSGRAMRASRVKFSVRQAARSFNRLFDSRFLYFRGTAFKPVKELIRKQSDW